MRNYYTVAVRENGQWAIHFGDYSRAVAASEQMDILEGDASLTVRDCRIIKTSDAQAAIDAAIAALNA